MTDPVTITFTSSTSFDVSGASAGLPVTGVGYTSGSPLSFNGWTAVISGQPRAGDVFNVVSNAGGNGDNRNALAMGRAELAGTVDGGRASFQDAYGRLVADVGVQTSRFAANRDAQEAMLTQLENEREAVSGVNLDEEAANLLRFQQAFQANARLIAVADELFESLLGAVSR